MAFSIFQTATGTLKKITTDYTGDETVSGSFSVNVDPVFGYKRVHTDENEEITGLKTVITSDSLEDDFDFTHRNWKIEYQGKDYQIESPVPFYTVGSNKLEHVEVVLR